MLDNIYMVAGIFEGDDSLTVIQAMDRLAERNNISICKGTAARWLGLACQQGLLERVTVSTQGREYAYYLVGAEPPIRSGSRFAFSSDFYCHCGESREVGFMGSSLDLETKFKRMAWSCEGCGDFIRLSDCVQWKDLLRLYASWMARNNEDYDPRIACVTVGRL